MAGKDNTTRIEWLESQYHGLVARLEAQNVDLEWISEQFAKVEESTAGHHTKIIVIEQQLIALVSVKDSLATIVAIEKEIVGLKKDIEANAKWQDEERKRQETWGHRFWMIVPPLLAALLSSALTYTLFKK